MERIILHIDMNSYFASVEQQARPSLRGKPIGVVGSSNPSFAKATEDGRIEILKQGSPKRTIIAAASVEAKKFGVKTGTQLYEAKRLCPQIILVGADCVRYEAVTRQFLQIFISKTPLVEIFSIDEAFLDLTDSAKSFKEAAQIAQDIKEQMKEKIGSFIKCSIGIAQNKFMAKLAGEAHKPDGLTVVLPGEEIEFINRFELTDACGIGSRTELHLNTLGIHTFEDLRAMRQTDLTLIFNSYGLRLYNMARGIDFSPVLPYFLRPKAKSISRSKTLPTDTWDKTLIAKMILSFCQNITAELRDKKLLAGGVGVYLRYKDFTGAGQDKAIKTQTKDTIVLYKNALSVLGNILSTPNGPHYAKATRGAQASFCSNLRKPVRKIGIWAGRLTDDPRQELLFEDYKKPLILENVADCLNKKYGSTILKRAALVNLGFSGRAPSFGFKRDISV